MLSLPAKFGLVGAGETVMIDTLKDAQRIERELGIERDKAASATFILRDMIVEARGDVVPRASCGR